VIKKNKGLRIIETGFIRKDIEKKTIDKFLFLLINKINDNQEKEADKKSG
tara:strand:+ start:234 stop:383 length:150 start_codon:yes stop_codon:yes gene_type:complete